MRIDTRGAERIKTDRDEVLGKVRVGVLVDRMWLAVLPLLHELCSCAHVIHLIKLEVRWLANTPAS